MLLPQIPLEGCQVPPFPKVWASVELCDVLSSLLFLPGAVEKSPNRVDRCYIRILAGYYLGILRMLTVFMVPVGLLAAAEDIIEDVSKFRYVYGNFWSRKKNTR